MRVRLLVVTLAFALPLAGHSALANPDDQGELEVSSHGLTVDATEGTACRNGDGVSFCADAAYPLRTRGRLRVHAGGRVHFRTGARAERVTAAPVEVTDGDRIRFVGKTKLADPRDEDGRRWRVNLPGDLPDDANVLDVDVDYGSRGDSNFWAGLRVHRRGD